MNFPRHTFCPESKVELLGFLKISSEQKVTNKYCNLDEYEILKKVFPMDDDLEVEFKQFIDKQMECIDITQSDDDQEPLTNNPQPDDSLNLSYEDVLITTLQSLNETTARDIVDDIKENLENKEVTSNVISNLCECSNDRVETIFKLLEPQLNFEQVYYFGFSVKDAVITNECVISSYFRYLLLKKVVKGEEFSEIVQSLLQEFSNKYSTLLVNEISEYLLEIDENELFLQYVAGLSCSFKAKLFGKFIINCQTLHISTTESLLNSQIEPSHLTKLVELLSISAEKYSTDKSYGNLVLNVVPMLGKNITMVEQPLKHIIGTHRSIWKVKMQKLFSSRLDETMSQSQVEKV